MDIPNRPISAVDEQLPDHNIQVQDLYQRWFLDYASYVILERAVPAIEDGFKPVQRRIMHALNEMDDGRFNKVANVIGQTMQYHPHGDASIGDAMVGLGQKDILIETQGNWGDYRTGDSAAAPRYIEARLSKLAKDIVFNPKTTEWQLSYDGRKKEPVTLPVKFPLLLAQGVEGIAVGLATKILPHNFIELLEASIDIVNGKPVSIYPDFLTGGLMDASMYNEGLRGGKIKVRAKIEELDKKTLAIKEIPYGVTTGSMIDSIIKANDAGKIKIRKVIDNTAAEVEIQVHLLPGVSPDVTIDALYAFTECEVSISPNCCVIVADKPRFLSVNEILRICNQQTQDLLKRELEIKKAELLEKILFSSLEKIFIENRIYRDIEECETFEAVIQTIDKGLDPFKSQFYREITREDILELTEIKIKRISKYDGFKADELMRGLEAELTETEENLANLKGFTIRFYKELLKKYGKGRERKTEIRQFDTIQANSVAATNQKLYVNREEGFLGYGLKKDEFVCDCSDIDDIIAFRRDGSYKIVRIEEKVFVGKDVMHVAVFRKTDERLVYNVIYLDGDTGTCYGKRFQVTGITRDKEYNLTKGTRGSKVAYFTHNPNGEAEKVTILLTPGCKAKVKTFDYDFSTLEIKGRAALGNIVTKYPVRKIQFREAGFSTLGSLAVYYDEITGKLNRDSRGKKLGEFTENDSILIVYKDGNYEIVGYDLSQRFEPSQLFVIEKFDPEAVISGAYLDGGTKTPMLKKFKIETSTRDKKFPFIPLEKGTQLWFATTKTQGEISVSSKTAKGQEVSKLLLEEIGDVKGWKAMGTKVPVNGQIREIKFSDN